MFVKLIPFFEMIYETIFVVENYGIDQDLCFEKSFFGSPRLNEHLIMAFNFDSPNSLPDLMDFNHQI